MTYSMDGSYKPKKENIVKLKKYLTKAETKAKDGKRNIR